MAGRDVTVRWRERMLFEGGASGKPAILVDGNGAEATSPVELLLLAAATCSAADVVSILEKQRVVLKALDIQVR
jgi:putative redox protein